MRSHYEPKAVEPRWQDRWDRQRSGETDLRYGLGKEYMLVRLRPSDGSLDPGAVRAAIAGDVHFRFSRMNGRKAFSPLDWDGFGAAAACGAPREPSAGAVKAARDRLRRWGALHDGSKEILSSQPESYRWSQWLFLRLLDRGLAFQDGGRWWARVGDLANDLRAGLDELPEWPTGIKAMQRALAAASADGPGWMLSRPGAWGPPVPVIHCPACGAVPVPEDELPVEPPRGGAGAQGAEGAEGAEGVEVRCPRCGGPARRDPQSLDPALDLGWIGPRHLAPRDSGRLVDPQLAERWLPVDLLLCPPAQLPLLRARFAARVLHDLGATPTAEPFLRVSIPGKIAGWSPDAALEEHGADVARVAVLSLGSLERGVEWSEEAAAGAQRFLRRVWRIGTRLGEAPPTAPADGDLERRRHAAIRRVTDSLRRFHCNAAVAALIDLSRALARAVEEKTASRLRCDEAFDTLLQLLHPLAPHITEELWEKRDHIEALLETSWPEYDVGKARGPRVQLAVQVDGKLRDRIVIDPAASDKETRAAALARPRVQEHLDGRDVAKVHLVPGRLINLVTRRSA
jgi:leucyl-tRNA synthetase